MKKSFQWQWLKVTNDSNGGIRFSIDSEDERVHDEFVTTFYERKYIEDLIQLLQWINRG